MAGPSPAPGTPQGSHCLLLCQTDPQGAALSWGPGKASFSGQLGWKKLAAKELGESYAKNPGI